MDRNIVELKVTQLVRQAVKAELITELDTQYSLNRVLAHLKIDAYSGKRDESEQLPLIPDLLSALIDDAVQRGVIEDLTDEREILSAQLMDAFLDKPSQINQTFWRLYQEQPGKATNWFYQLSQASNYIQTKNIARNLTYKASSQYGELDITINLSKPEKNPRDIAAAKMVRSTSYPACLLCPENEGFAGRNGHPARANHRLIRMTLGGEPWYLQYSPYVYYPEHCIVLAQEHRDMEINRVLFERLIEFITVFPDYFIGSNADLPIVGGSILTHDHYQGGKYTFAMARAPVEQLFCLSGIEQVSCGIVRWPMSVLRLRSVNAAACVDAADRITRFWRHYSDPKAGILASSNDTPHNTVTPIARRVGLEYEFDLVLRNNRQSEEHPMGIFHPHQDVHHIKKENIGLIEVMGLAVLPPRLYDELAVVEAYLQKKAERVAAYHQNWADDLVRQNGFVDASAAKQIVRQAVASRFERVLADAGVFKRDSNGQEAFNRFISALLDQISE